MHKSIDALSSCRCRAATLVSCVFAIAACDTDILDVDVDLAAQSYAADFGPSPGTIPDIACDPAMTGMCLEGQTLVGTPPAGPLSEVRVEAGCDPATRSCFAQAEARAWQEVNVLQDEAFTTRVARRAVSAVRRVDLGYEVPVNTLTFDLPRVDVYVGPGGTVAETDAGVVMVGSLDAVAASTTFVTTRRHLVLEDGSSARALIEERIQAQQPFVFVLVAAPRMESGAPMPGGAFTIVFHPRLSLGLR
jgi:hypothetical protein